MNCVDNCALCGQDLRLKERNHCRMWEYYELAKHIDLQVNWAEREPAPLLVDEDGCAVCECTAEDSLARRAG